MKSDLNITLGLLGVTSLYVLFFCPIGYTLLTVSFAVMAFVVTGDMKAALGAVVLMIFLRWFGNVMKPQPKIVVKATTQEGFQAKDPITIHQRIAAQKKDVPKVRDVTGVLESPEILDSMHIAPLKAEEEGFANMTMPALANSNTPINTPDESSMPAKPSPDTTPMSNPYLQNGPDAEAVNTAMTPKGNSFAPVTTTSGMNVGPANYQ